MLNSEQRELYTALAEALIPASDVMPSATEAGVAEKLIDQALSYRPDLADDFDAAVMACAGVESEAALDHLAEHDPVRFKALTLLSAGAYLLSPLVQAALDYNPPPRPVGDDIDTYADMLADVVERGFHIR